MENFIWTEFSRQIAVKAPIQTIYNAWAIPSEITKWFLKSADYTYKGVNISSMAQVQEAFEYKWTWFLYDGEENNVVTQANGKDHFQFKFAGECIVDVKFSEKLGHTIVDLKQRNIPTDDKSKQDIRLGCDRGWSFYLVNLKSVYEGGIDLRNKDPELGVKVNN